MRRGIVRIGFVVTLASIVLFALGGAAIALPPDLGNVGQNGPTPPKLGDPVANQSEVQWISITVTGTPSGTYTLGTDAGTTAAIDFNKSPASALNTLYGGSSTDTRVTAVGGPVSANFDANNNLQGTFYWRVMWVGSLAGTDFAQMTANTGALVGETITIETYENGATIGTARVQPHGGYNATTDYCLQCHSVHDGGDYALLASSSVTATCRTCHSLFGQNPTGNINPGIPGEQIAPTSMRAAYEVVSPKAQHQLGSTGIPFSTVATITESGWHYGGFSATGWAHDEAAGPGTASDVSGGLYCGDCHTPHGDFGQLINSKKYRSTAPGGSPADLSGVYDFAEGNAIYFNRAIRYLHKDADPVGVWEACTAANPTAVAAGPDTGCSYLTTSDAEGENAYLYGYKLLSSYPNHSWDQKPVSWNLDANNHDSSLYCARCHDKALPSEYGGTYHNHPTGCTACHGNPNDGTSSDFPHTSTFVEFLKDYPDLLCINCHTAGSLP